MYGCESWTVKKAERQRIDAFELWCRQTRQQEGRRPRRTDTSYGRRPQMVQGSWDIWLFELEKNETDKLGTGRGESHAGLTHPVDAGHRWSRVLGLRAKRLGPGWAELAH